MGFFVRTLFQRSEMRAREALARELVAELPPSMRVPDSDGYLRFPSSAEFDWTRVCAHGAAIAKAHAAGEGASPNGKAFHRNQLADSRQLADLLAVALDRRLVAIATSYLGIVPVIADLDYVLSLPSPKPWNKSQLWHCDDDAPRQLKLFIYCEDVTEQDGPFEMIAASDSERVRSEIGYRYAGRRYRVTDELMTRHLEPERQLSIQGKRGSAFFVDTARCFHKGSRIEEPGHRRIAAVVLYCTPNGAKLPLRLAARPGPFAYMTPAGAGLLERAVLGNPVA